MLAGRRQARFTMIETARVHAASDAEHEPPGLRLRRRSLAARARICAHDARWGHAARAPSLRRWGPGELRSTGCPCSSSSPRCKKIGACGVPRWRQRAASARRAHGDFAACLCGCPPPSAAGTTSRSRASAAIFESAPAWSETSSNGGLGHVSLRRGHAARRCRPIGRRTCGRRMAVSATMGYHLHAVQDLIDVSAPIRVRQVARHGRRPPFTVDSTLWRTLGADGTAADAGAAVALAGQSLARPTSARDRPSAAAATRRCAPRTGSAARSAGTRRSA